MSKQDDQFLPEQVDEQIETLAHLGNSSALPEARLTSDLHHIYAEEHEIAERVWVRLNSHTAQGSEKRTKQKHPKHQTLHMFIREAQPMKIQETQQPPEKTRLRGLETFATALIIVILVGSMAVLVLSRHALLPSLGGKGAILQSGPPTSVTLRLSASGIPSITHGEITIPSGTKVTLTVIPDHSLLPYQTYTMGIYATDPYGFSELKDCTYPHTDTCSYTIAYSSSEGTDYTKGKHTFVAFLGNIGGNILNNSDSITVIWK